MLLLYTCIFMFKKIWFIYSESRDEDLETHLRSQMPKVARAAGDPAA